MLKDPDLFKFQNKEERAEGKMKEKASKLSYDNVKPLVFKGSHTSLLKKLNLIEKASFTFPGFGGGLDIHKAIANFLAPKLVSLQANTFTWGHTTRLISS